MVRTQKVKVKVKSKKQAQAERSAQKNKKLHRSVLLTAILAFTFVSFVPVLKNGFTNWDDPGYVIDNSIIKDISGEGLKEIFTTPLMGNYHPLALLSLALDYKFSKLNPYGYHLTNLLAHLLNVTCLFFFLLWLKGPLWAAGIAALLFGIHPMHVESVAWISERKDVGYVLFYLVTLLLYIRYSEEQKRRFFYYILMLFTFLVSLLFKGQAVTIPIVMLLIDYYKGRKIKSSWMEKIPFFVVAVFFGIVAVLAQKESHSIQDIKLYPFYERALFACYALGGYLWKCIVPYDLSALYPYPVKSGGFYPWTVYASPILIILLGWLFLKTVKKSRDILFGGVFFGVNILLLLQLLPVGGAIMADRYSYLGYAGLFFIAGRVFQRSFLDDDAALKKYKLPGIILLAGYLSFLAASTYERCKVWHDSGKLFTDVIQKYPEVPIAFNNLGSYYQKQNMLEQARISFNEAIRLQPAFPDALINRADLYRVTGKLDSSIHDCTYAIYLRPNLTGAYMNRGIAYSIVNKPDSALRDFNKVISLDPANAKAYGNRGNLFSIKDLPQKAVADYNQAVSLDPAYQDVYGNRARAYIKMGMPEDAISDLTKAIRYAPYNAEHYYLLAVAYQDKQEWKSALENALYAKSLGKNIDPAVIEFLQEKSKAGAE